MDAQNLIVIMTDGHDPRYLGAAGNTLMKPRRLTGSRQTALISRTHTRPAQFAYRHERPSRPGGMFTRQRVGTMRRPMTAAFRGGPSIYGMPDVPSKPLARCTTAASKIRSATTDSMSQCI